jgi:hypothetical protein
VKNNEPPSQRVLDEAEEIQRGLMVLLPNYLGDALNLTTAMAAASDCEMVVGEASGHTREWTVTTAMDRDTLTNRKKNRCALMITARHRATGVTVTALVGDRPPRKKAYRFTDFLETFTR